MQDLSPINFVASESSDILIPKVPIPPRHFFNHRSPSTSASTTNVPAPAPPTVTFSAQPRHVNILPTPPVASASPLKNRKLAEEKEKRIESRRQVSAAIDHVVQRRIEKRDLRLKTLTRTEIDKIQEPKKEKRSHDAWSKALNRLYYHGLFQRLKQTEGLHALTKVPTTDAEIRVDLAVTRADHKYHPIDTRRFKKLLAERLAIGQQDAWDSQLDQINKRTSAGTLLMDDFDDE